MKYLLDEKNLTEAQLVEEIKSLVSLTQAPASSMFDREQLSPQSTRRTNFFMGVLLGAVALFILFYIIVQMN